MISVHLLTREECAERLTSLGYEAADRTIEGHSCWKAPCGTHMLVPELPPDGMVAEDRLMEQVSEIKALNRLKAH